jgi:hypothetical protein
MAAMERELTQTYRLVSWDIGHPGRIPAGPQIPDTPCLKACKKALMQFRTDYNYWELKTCPTDYLCQHPTPLIEANAQVHACQNTKDCPKPMALAIYKHYRWVFKNGGVKQFEDEWKCGKNKQPCHVDCTKGVRCSGKTNWIALINLGGQIVGYGCILLTEGIGALVCTGFTAVVVTVLDQVVDKANAKDKGAAAFRNGLVSAGPFIVTFLKQVFTKAATEGDG